MANRRGRWLGVGLLGTAGAGLVGLTSVMNAAFALGDDGTALIMGYASDPSPDQAYVDRVDNLFINPTDPFLGQAEYPGYASVVQYTPEETISDTGNGDPFAGFDTLAYQQSATQGAADLDQGISQALANGPVTVFGYSSSASAATDEMINLDALPAGQQPDPADLNFILVADLNNPDGGIFERFPGLYDLPATPADTPFDTQIDTVEYDGSADFPQYPGDLPADLNALMGYTDLHTFLTSAPSTFDTSELADAVQEPVSPGYYADGGVTEYFLIPTQDLPLLDPLRYLPGGNVLADMVQPDLRVIVDLGYDRSGDANVSTPAELYNPNIDWTTVESELALGAQQGITAAEVDMGMLPASDLPDAYPYLPDVSGLMTAPASTVSASTGSSVDSLQSLLSGTDISALGSELTSLLNGLPDGLPPLASDLSALGLGFLG